MRRGKRFHIFIISDIKRKIKDKYVTIIYKKQPYIGYNWWMQEHKSIFGIKYERYIVKKIRKTAIFYTAYWNLLDKFKRLYK